MVDGYQRLDYTISFLICSKSLGAFFAAKTVLLLCTEFFSIDVEDHLRIYVAYHVNGKTIGGVGQYSHFCKYLTIDSGLLIPLPFREYESHLSRLG